MDEKLMEYFEKRLDRLEQKLDDLISFRWLLVGAAVGVSGLLSVLFNVFINLK
jgi:hypothetical protein